MPSNMNWGWNAHRPHFTQIYKHRMIDGISESEPNMKAFIRNGWVWQKNFKVELRYSSIHNGNVFYSKKSYAEKLEHLFLFFCDSWCSAPTVSDAIDEWGFFDFMLSDGHVGNKQGSFGRGHSSNQGWESASKAVIRLDGSYKRSLFIRSNALSLRPELENSPRRWLYLWVRLLEFEAADTDDENSRAPGSVSQDGQMSLVGEPRILNMWLIWSMSEVPGNKGLPESNSPKIQPIDQISAGEE